MGKKPFIDRKHSTTYRLVYRSQNEGTQEPISPQFVPKTPVDKQQLKKNPALRTFFQKPSQANETISDDELELDDELAKHFEDAVEFDVEEDFEDEEDGANQFVDLGSDDDNEDSETDGKDPIVDPHNTSATDKQTNQEGRKRLKYRADDYEYGDLGFPDDGYDYSQHLKKHDDECVFIPVKGKPTSFEKNFFEQPKPSQTTGGMIEEDIDPEILDALNQDYDDADDNAKEWGDLLDNFIEIAGGEDEEQTKEADFFKAPKDQVKVKKTTKKKIGKKIELPPAKNYTDESDRTSLNERFAAVAETYNEEDIGNLDGEVIGGTINVNTLMDMLDEFEESQKMAHPFDHIREVPLIPMPSSHKDAHGKFFEVLASIKERSSEVDTENQQSIEALSESEDDYEEIEVVDKKKDWDCESVVSSFTSTENQCRLIKEPPKGAFKIALSKKTGIPLGVLPPPRSVKKDVVKVSLTKFYQPDASLLDVNHQGQQQTTGNGEEEEEGSVQSVATTISIRPDNESAEERKIRKQLTKQARKVNRERKKKLKTKYHSENLRLQTISAQQPFQRASVLPIL